MKAAEIQQSEEKTVTNVQENVDFGLVGTDEHEGETCWSCICMLEGNTSLLTGTFTGTHSISSTSTTGSNHHWSSSHAEEVVNLHHSFLFWRNLCILWAFPPLCLQAKPQWRLCFHSCSSCFLTDSQTSTSLSGSFYSSASPDWPMSTKCFDGAMEQISQRIRLRSCVDLSFLLDFQKLQIAPLGLRSSPNWSSHWLHWLLPDNSIFHKLHCFLAARGDCVSPGSDSRLGVERLPSPPIF